MEAKDIKVIGWIEEAKQAGRKEVMDWIEGVSKAGHPSKFIPSFEWQAKLKEWGIK